MLAHEEALGLERLQDAALVTRGEVDAQRVEDQAFAHALAGGAQRLGQHLRLALHARRDALQARGAVVDGVAGGDHGQQHLRGADVARGLLAPDVLLARLQRQAQRGLAVAVDRDADQAAGHRALVGLARGEVGRVRAAEAQRHAEALRVADRDVGAELARRFEQEQRERVGRHDDQRARAVRTLDERARVAQQAVAGRVLQQGAEDRCSEVEQRRVARDDLQAQGVRARAHDLDRLRMAVGGDEEVLARVVLADVEAERHGLGRGGALVEHRGVGDLQARELEHHRLVGEQRLEPALADLGLVGRVLRVPARVLEHVALDHRRRDAVVVAHPEQRAPDLVLGRDAGQLAQRVALAGRRTRRERDAQAQRLRHGRVGELLERAQAEDGEHRREIALARADVTIGEAVLRVERVASGLVGLLALRRRGARGGGAHGVGAAWGISAAGR